MKKLENIEDEKLNKEYEEYLKIENENFDKRIKDLCHNSIFWTDANPRMARVSKMNMIMHWDGHNWFYHNSISTLLLHHVKHGPLDYTSSYVLHQPH